MKVTAADNSSTSSQIYIGFRQFTPVSRQFVIGQIQTDPQFSFNQSIANAVMPSARCKTNHPYFKRSILCSGLVYKLVSEGVISKVWPLNTIDPRRHKGG